MSAKKFKFVSPGVFLSEIDKSQLPKVAAGVGPVIIGRTRRGPALKPVKVSSFQEFVEVFGEPVAGNGGDDAWRDGNGLGATAYAPYAAQAYLKADINSPVTVIRLAGIEGDDSGDAGEAGWTATDAYGLFFAHSGSKPSAHLGAIIYTDNASFKVGVKGTQHISGAAAITSSYADAIGTATAAVRMSNKSFTLLLTNGTNTVEKTVSLREGPGYIRDVLNTNPVATNELVMAPPAASLAADYWLGETFEEEFENIIRSGSSDDKLIVFPVKLSEGMDDFKTVDHQLVAAASGWIIPQYVGASGSFVPESQERLFRLHALQEGEQGMDLSIHIEDINIPGDGSPTPYGSFSLVVKQRQGDRIVTIESFSDLNLNPNSNNFVARRIGDQYFEWDSSQKRNKVYGNHPNQSTHIRVEMNLDVEENGPTNPASVPFGYFGPIVHDTIGPITFAHGSESDVPLFRAALTTAAQWITGSLISDPATMTNITFKWPESPHVISGSKASGFGGRFVMGHTEFDKLKSDSTAMEFGGAAQQNFASVNRGAKDYLRRMGSHNSSAVLAAQKTGITAAGSKYSYIFSLDDVVVTGSTSLSNDMSGFNPEFVVFRSGSHVQDATPHSRKIYQKAFTTITGSDGMQLSASALLDVVSGFAMPMAGGFDGVDITEADPFNMSTRAVGPDATTKDNYAYASIDRAIELIKDPEAIEMNLAVMPGITNVNLTEKLIQTCEARADAMAIIDLPDVYVPPSEKICANFQARVNQTNAAKSAKALRARKINSSYGAAYYPWVKVKDSINNRDVWVPPSVIALGVMGYTEQRDEVWFAPAGFNRGGLNEGNAGLKVLQASEQLLSSERDKLYEANINPIASFVSEGLVVFGQKTLQSTASALDRINVRRLLIFVKKEVSRISNGLLFDQNVPATWARFTGQVVPFLESVKTRLGLTDFKVILDETTTTPDLVDRNIMYAKIFLKPARAIEFIAVDFVITRSGASFDD